MRKKNKQKISDLIDIEYFLSFEDEKIKQDKDLLLKIRPEMSDSACLKLWLSANRKNIKTSFLMPGEFFLLLWKLFSFVLNILSFFSGFLLIFQLFNYDGKVPVNILYAFFILSVLPFLSFILSLSFILFSKRLPFLYRWTFSLFIKLLFKLSKNLKYKFFTDYTLSQKKAHIDNFIKNYAFLIKKLLFYLFQSLAFLFISGMFLAFILKLLGSDLAFAWQSTLIKEAKTLHYIIKIIASPWFFLWPFALPDISLIEGSRLILKEGILNLKALHLSSWWSFLFMSFIFYALIPRFFLLLYSYWTLNRSLEAFDFKDIRVQRLIFYLKDSVLNNKYDEAFISENIKEGKEEKKKDGFSEDEDGAFLWDLWITDEISDLEYKGIIEKLEKTLKSPPFKIRSLDIYDSFFEEDDFIRTKFIVLESFMPPLKEDLSFLDKIAKKNKAPVWIWLEERKIHEDLDLEDSAKENNEKIKNQEFLIWKEKLKTLKEPRPDLYQERRYGA